MVGILAQAKKRGVDDGSRHAHEKQQVDHPFSEMAANRPLYKRNGVSRRLDGRISYENLVGKGRFS